MELMYRHLHMYTSRRMTWMMMTLFLPKLKVIKIKIKIKIKIN